MGEAALERMFLCLAEEVRPYNIAVNVLSPGRVDTWMNRNGDWPGTTHIPMEQPDTIIPAAVWLATQTAASFTGHVVEGVAFGVTWGPGIPVASSIEPHDMRTPPCAHETRPEPSAADGKRLLRCCSSSAVKLVGPFSHYLQVHTGI
jgi:hypothetical protein